MLKYHEVGAMDRITEQPNTSPGSIRRMLPDDETIYELADLFKMFGDPTRAKILRLPADTRSVCGRDCGGARA